MSRIMSRVLSRIKAEPFAAQAGQKQARPPSIYDHSDDAQDSQADTKEEP